LIVSRVHILLLVFVSAVLVLDGATHARVVPLAFETADVYDAERVALIVSDINPSLSTAEQRRIGEAVVRNSEKYGLDPELVTAVVIVESNARPWVVSRKGAVGLMQVMPHMVGGMELVGNLTTIESNIEAGCLILADNIRRLGEDDGISAYFWGSDIRGVAYLDRVRAARATIRRRSQS
jgi:soluble lytic murein transglycosylase-like protein